jgi:hypothetical protein
MEFIDYIDHIDYINIRNKNSKIREYLSKWKGEAHIWLTDIGIVLWISSFLAVKIF